MKTNFIKELNQDQGFTLIEILVALLLVTIILFFASGSSYSTRRNLDDLLNNLERTTRFSTDEASLKSQFVRIKIDLDGEDQAIELEYSDDTTLVLDDPEELKDLSEDELKERDKKKKSSFSAVQEFDSDDINVPLGVRIVGIGSGLTGEFTTEGTAYIYFYPTGEKDAALIVAATDDEIGYISISPFQRVIERNYIGHGDDVTSDNFTEYVINQATEAYKEWLSRN